MNNKITEVIQLPADSTEFVKAVRQAHGVTAINPYLSYNRFCRHVKKEKDSNEPFLFETLLKRPLSSSAPCFDREIIDILNKRNRAIASRYPGRTRPYTFRTKGKLICGMGGASPYGNIQLLRLHHVFGIPYIPASAIKGSLRNYIILEDFGGNEAKAEQTAEFSEIFGVKTEGQQAEGQMIFFDAFPLWFKMGLDIQTPHFRQYYAGERENPLDNEQPLPLFFTCLQNAEFQIYIACSKAEIWKKYEKSVDRAMKGVFEEYGVGAKTSLGYGGGELVL